MENKKKNWIVALLLLFAVIGIAGYGVYSYYYTEGTINTEEADDEDDDNVIHITSSFKPIVYQSSGINTFLGNGGTIELSCPDVAEMNTKITCDATIEVQNNGSTPIRVSYSDFTADVSSDDISNVSKESASISWSDTGSSYTTISAGSYAYLDIEVEVNVGNVDSNSSNEAILVTGPVSAGTLSAYASFRLDATQNTNY